MGFDAMGFDAMGFDAMGFDAMKIRHPSVNVSNTCLSVEDSDELARKYPSHAMKKSFKAVCKG
ncbi:hypothetical protein DI09_400p10 [Mitosporidium daphniae]|uniref:Uncharacterized protein n=1 Tax=Mitosporidium daphniae TaxID=1485682 RepID=A0A098VQU2_9MICR|nr:uncharacterized protein DI09_400p10 [Mitosporidium daphniae]KGG51325.1 hypothetical protein DI09_400p10 [Mitosporidium daphniae]|eukprot:XP_013237761.1 uncharacterized protein DI09_400p10 [Mitosporidium daphniae]